LVGDTRQGRAIVAVMAVLALGSLTINEVAQNAHHGTVPQAVGAATEGTEARFGVPDSALFATGTTLTSTGSVNSLHDSYTSLGGTTLLFNMMLSEVAPGGTGSGLYGMLVLAVLTVFVAGLMIGRTPEYLTRAALSLGADTGAAPPRLLAGYGSLLCTAAYASAQRGDRSAALDLVGEAEQAAVRLGERRPGSGVFGSANVAVYRIGIHTALGEPGVALTYARAVDQRLLPVPERHARFWIDTARAWDAFGRADRAYASLRAAERHAAEELHRPSVRAFVAGLLYGSGPTPTGLRALATRTGAVDSGH
jgi:hypothetical protein